MRHRRSLVLLTAVSLTAVLAACGDTPTPPEEPTGPEETTDGDATAEYPEDLVVEVQDLSGSVPPPWDSLETVTIGPDGLTYTAGSRYEDEPMFSETLEPEDGALAAVMAAWEALDVPPTTADYDDSHHSEGDGGDYVITYVTGTGYDSTATGDDDAMDELVAVALDQVPEDVRAEGQAVIEEYNDSEDG